MNDMPVLPFLRKFYKWCPDASDYLEDDFLFTFGSTSNAIMHSTIFTPDFIIINESVLLSWLALPQIVDSFKKGLIENKFSREGLEAQFNTIEVGYFFGKEEKDISDENDELLANRIAESWRAWLGYKFPNRHFVVEVLDPEETGDSFEVRFFQKR